MRDSCLARAAAPPTPAAPSTDVAKVGIGWRSGRRVGNPPPLLQLQGMKDNNRRPLL